MAESIMAHLLQKTGNSGRAEVASAAAHTDELGSPPHRETREILKNKGIPLVPHRARLMMPEDGEKYDILIGMDKWNVADMKQIVGPRNAGKVHLFLEFSPRPRPIADPWYTGNFDETYRDISEGCDGLLSHLKERGIVT